MANGLIFYNSSLEQSLLSAFIAYYKYEKVLGYSVTVKDTYGVSAADLLTYVETSGTQDSYTRIAICSLTEATGTTAGKVKYDTIAAMRQMLITASKGTTVTSGTCAANSTVTEIVLATGASDEDDTYNGDFIETTLTATPLIRKGRNITDYVGSTLTATVLSTGSAVTTTSTYVVYNHTHVDIIGDAVSTENACHVAWTTLFPSTKAPKIVQLLGGVGTGYQPCRNTVVSADSFDSTTLTDTGVFTLNEFTDGDFYIAGHTATTNAGQVVKITSNTADVLTHAAWPLLPTGTLTYSIWQGRQYCLYDLYLPYAIKTYYYTANAENLAKFIPLLDRYGDLVANASAVQTFTDLATLDEIAALGKPIFDALKKGVVS